MKHSALSLVCGRYPWRVAAFDDAFRRLAGTAFSGRTRVPAEFPEGVNGRLSSIPEVMYRNGMNDAGAGKTQRLFVAVELPAAIRQLLAERQAGLPGMRWIAPDNLHLTVRFIGEVPQTRVASVQAGLRNVRMDGFPLQVKGLGFFDKRPQAVLWAGVEASESLTVLKRQVDDVLERHAGLKTPGGRFSPHITLGRAKQADRKALRAFTAGDSATFTARFEVDSFTLFSSVLTPGGAVHTAEERYPLGGGNVPVKHTGGAAASLQ